MHVWTEEPRRTEEPKPSLSIGYVTGTPEDIQLSLEALTLEEKKEPLKLSIMDNSAPTTLGDSNYGRWKIEMMATLVVHDLDKIVTGDLPEPTGVNTQQHKDWTKNHAQAKLLLK